MLTFAELRKNLNGFTLNKILLFYLKNLQFHSFAQIQLERERERDAPPTSNLALSSFFMVIRPTIESEKTIGSSPMSQARGSSLMTHARGTFVTPIQPFKYSTG